MSHLSTRNGLLKRGKTVDRGYSSFATAAILLLAVQYEAIAQELFPPPVSPEQWITRSIESDIRIDGRLDEAAWESAEQIVEFIQKEPLQGKPGTYRTIVRVMYDDKALYVSAWCEQPRDTLRIQNLERDFDFDDNDLFGIAIDGFLDRRNAVAFQVTPRGNQRDLEVIDGTDSNIDWNARWDVRTRSEDDHWTVEMAIPWRTLRYLDGTDRLGVIFTRNVRHLNEQTAAPPVPRALSIYRMAYQGELVELEAPSPSANVQINPYALVDYSDSQEEESDFEAGGELKWAITPSTVLDVTVNTDFAQAEVDRQVVNLERFSVFFPERRQFFLENANLFNASVSNWIRPFFSRRIGLDDFGSPIPLDGGLRLTSRTSKQELGVLAMSQRASGLNPASMYGVARYSRNLAGQSRLGGMFTVRRDEEALIGDIAGQTRDNFTYTLDGLWRPSQAVGVQGMISASEDSIDGSGVGGQLWAFYENNWIYVGLLEYYNRDYEPGVGLEILDTNYVMHSPAASLDLRPETLPASIRSFNPGAEAYVFQSSDDGELLFAYAPIRPLRFFFQDGAQIGLTVEPNWQRLEEPFFPAGIEVAPGRYDYTRYRLNWDSDQSASLGARLSVETGNYFDGELTSYSASARYAPFPELEVSADVDINRIRGLGVAQVDDETRVLGLSVRIAPSPQLQFRVLYQQNSVGDRDNWNARLSWEYRPLSFIYLVYNRNEIAGLSVTERPKTEQVILKMTYLFEV